MDRVKKLLNNSLKKDKLSHCILFEGYRNHLKIDYAFRLACAIVTEQKSIDNLDEAILKRIQQQEYTDVVYISGSDSSIKKEDIEKLFKQFKMTGLELGAKKVYILENINNASTKVLNMLLKFMEEPASKDVYGILISDFSEQLLDTIKSRSTRISFPKVSGKEAVDIFLEHGFKDAEILVKLGYEYAYFSNLELYEQANQLSLQLFDHIEQLDEFLFYLHQQYFEKIKAFDKNSQLQAIKLFIDLSIYRFKQKQSYRIVEVLLKTKEKINQFFDSKLVLDEMVYNLVKEI